MDGYGFRSLEKCAECPIRHRAVCANCSPDEFSVLEALKSYKTYAKGEAIAWAEIEMTHLGSIVSGFATLQRTMEDGRSQIVGLLLPSDFIGSPGRATVAYNVVAATEVVVCRFQKPAFEALLERSPAMTHRLLKMTSNDLEAARDWMLVLGRKTARERVASFLLMLAKRTYEDDDGLAAATEATVSIPLSRAELGDYLGLTLETTSRQISQLKRDGVLELVGQRDIHIKDLARLMDETCDDTA